MIDGIKDVVARLERQKTAIDKALASLAKGLTLWTGIRPGCRGERSRSESRPEA